MDLDTIIVDLSLCETSGISLDIDATQYDNIDPIDTQSNPNSSSLEIPPGHITGL